MKQKRLKIPFLCPSKKLLISKFKMKFDSSDHRQENSFKNMTSETQRVTMLDLVGATALETQQ